METAQDVVARMGEFLPAATDEFEARVRDFDVESLSRVLRELRLSSDDASEVAHHWDEFRRHEEWTSLLAALLGMVEVQRGAIDEPLPIWPDLDGAGPSGRLLYIYLFALGYEGTRTFHEKEATPQNVIDRTFEVLARHCATHQRKWGTLGVDAGWWMLPILRGELLQVGSLQFHRVTLGVGSLSPYSWYEDEEAEKLGPGFRRGDPSIGLHIPRGSDIAPTTLDQTFGEARDVLGHLWPVAQRRLVTCQSWLLDSRLITLLPSVSNVVHFQRRFTLLPRWYDDDDDVLDFVFERPATPINELPQSTTLERAIVATLQRGEHWRAGAGWMDFDGP
ncbi:MAG: acyltransferase domain-containing protein [Acidimicrobiales bacterium]